MTFIKKIILGAIYEYIDRSFSYCLMSRHFKTVILPKNSQFAEGGTCFCITSNSRML